MGLFRRSRYMAWEEVFSDDGSECNLWHGIKSAENEIL
jgi:hypothetical protein